MAAETILQSDILTKFVYPFLLVFFIVFAVLEKSKILGGEDKKQINAIVAFVVGLIFVGSVFPKVVLGNLILFLSLGLVIVFVVMLLWGFVASGESGFKLPDGLKNFLMVIIGIAVVIGVFWAFGVGETFWNWLFNSNWSDTFWTNALFLIVVAAAVAVVVGKKK